MNYDSWSSAELRTRIEELESLLSAMKQEAEEQVMLDFAWAGNLGLWQAGSS
jgi:hypothetical protein